MKIVNFKYRLFIAIVTAVSLALAALAYAQSFTEFLNVRVQEDLDVIGDITNSTGGDVTIDDDLTITGTCTGCGGGTPGGADTQVQYNDSGAFAGDANFTWNDATDELNIVGTITNSDGSAASPSYTFSSDPDTGLYNLTSNSLAWAVGGSIGMQLNSGNDLTITRNLISSGGSVYLAQQSSSPFTGSGSGQFWVRNDNPTVPMFTNEDDEEIQIATTESGSFVATFTNGCTTDITLDLAWVRVEQQVTLSVTADSGTCTSNSNGMATAVGDLPANLRPSITKEGYFGAAIDNGSVVSSCILLLSDGQLTVRITPSCGTGNWTATGDKRPPFRGTMSYVLD